MNRRNWFRRTIGGLLGIAAVPLVVPHKRPAVHGWCRIRTGDVGPSVFLSANEVRTAASPWIDVHGPFKTVTLNARRITVQVRAPQELLDANA